jgi:hypothetical protein
VKIARPFLSIFVVALMLVCQPTASYASNDNERATITTNVVLISDLHFDPRRPPGHAKSLEWTEADEPLTTDNFEKTNDPSYFLVRSALRAAHENCTNAAFIVCTGDFLAHGLSNDLAFKTEERVAQLFDESFHGVKVIPALGNNDSAGLDYSAPTKEFLRSFVAAWSGKVPNSSVDRKLTFANLSQNNGLYCADLPGLSNVTAVVFNSTLVCHPPPEFKDIGSQEEMVAASHAVNEAAHRKKLWLVFHVPPGLDYWSKRPDLESWCNAARNCFVDMMAENAPNITATFAAHTHKNEFKVVYKNHMPVGFISQIPAVAAGHGNNPSFQIANVECATGKIKDLRTFCLVNFSDLTYWQNFTPRWVEEKSFSEIFPDAYKVGSNHYDEKSLNFLLGELRSSDTLKEAYLLRHSTGHYAGSEKERGDFIKYLTTLQVTNEGESP